MQFKLLKLLLFIFILNASQAQASLLMVSHSNPSTGAHQMMSHNPEIAQHQQHGVNGCCKSKANASGSSQHCDDTTCQNGNCYSCSHCVSALTQITPASADPDTSYYHEDKVTPLFTVYHVADPRPPRT